MDRLANVERMKKLADEWRAKAKEPKAPEPEPEKVVVEEKPAKKSKEVVKDSEEK